MSHPYSLQYGQPAHPAGRLRAWGGALLVHGVAALALVLAWPQAGELIQQAIPIEVSLVEAARPPEPVRPPPPPPKRPPPQVAQPQPLAPPPPMPTPPAPVLATNTVTAAAMVAPPVVARPEPVVVAEPARPAPPPPPEPLVEARFDADYLANPKPVYPMASRRRAWPTPPAASGSSPSTGGWKCRASR